MLAKNLSTQQPSRPNLRDGPTPPALGGSHKARAEADNLRLPSDGYQIVGPPVAQYWLSNFNYKHQRKIRSYHVTDLANEIKSGRFREKTQISICELNGDYFITNGQHTLSAIVKADTPVELSVVIVHCETMQGVADDFTRHDTHLTRQVSDALVAHELDDVLGITRTELRWITAASLQYAYMIGVLNVKTATQTSNDQKILIVRKYGSIVLGALRTMIDAHAHKSVFLIRKTTLACATFVYNTDPDLCQDFYGEISKDDGLKQGDPRKTLLTLFRETSAGGGGWAARTGKRSVPDHMLIKSQALAFNAYVSGKELKILRPDRDAKTAMFKGIGEVRA